MDTPVLAVRHVSKSFAGVRALVDIDLEIAPGEIHCLAGENGSGKSTLIKVISGVHTPEHGTVSIGGRDFTHLTPAAAIDAGVRVIYQDFSIFPNLSVMENIALGSEVAAGRRLVNRSRMREVAREAVAKIGFDVDLDELVGNLSVADKQLVAISRALMGDAKLIIMDEPTTALTKKEVRALFDIVADLQSRGIAILFVSHKLEEVFEIAQRFTILRSGHKVITCPKEELDRASFARHMTGRDFAEERYQPGDIDEAPVLQVEGATVGGAFTDASLSVRPGEILGITGLLGSGRTELAMSLFGMLPLDSGRIRVKGQDVTLRGVRDAIEAGIAYVPEDRLTEGLFLSRSIGENITISELENFTKALGFIDKKAIRAEEKKWVKRLDVVTPDPANAVNTLSGGNQQKSRPRQMAGHQTLRPHPQRPHRRRRHRLQVHDPLDPARTRLPRHGRHHHLRRHRRSTHQLLDDCHHARRTPQRSHEPRHPHRGRADPAPVRGPRPGLVHRRGRELMPRLITKVLRANEFWVFLVIAALTLVIQARSGQFYTANNLVDLAGAMVVPGLFAVAAHLVLVSGGIDVSFPALASLAVYVTTKMLVDNGWNGPVIVPFLIAAALGAVLGAFNGIFTSRLTVPTLIITLGTANVFNGVMQGALKSVQINTIPESMRAFGLSSLFVARNESSGLQSSMPVSFLILVAVVAVAFFVTRYTMFGRSLFALGGDESAAARVGFKVRATKFWLYVLVGVIAALAGMVRTCSMGQMHPTNLLGMEMMVIAAVVLGGTAITGGKGSLTGVMLGTLLIVIVQNSMILMGIPTFWQGFALGLLIIVGTGVSALQVMRGRRNAA